MSILKYNGTANPAACAANAKYISRERACDDLSFHNLPDLETRADFLAYAERRAEEEAERPARGNGIQRNHHRLVLSWDRTETSAAVREQTQSFLKENFPNARAAIAVHQDKAGQSHAHVWLDARGTDGRKLRVDKAKFKTLDERWARAYDTRYGTDYERDYQQKKAETRDWKRDRVAGIDRPKPARARDGMTGDRWREKDLRDSGVKKHEPDQERPDRNKRFDTDGQRHAADSERAVTDAGRAIDSRADTVERTEQGIGGLAGAINGAVRAVEETGRESESLHSDFTRLGEREPDRDLDHDRDDGRAR
jgi:hypothetical protein